MYSVVPVGVVCINIFWLYLVAMATGPGWTLSSALEQATGWRALAGAFAIAR